MASILKRKDSYFIAVSCGYDQNGSQIRRTMTYTPDKNMTEKQIQKEVQRQAVLFEEQVRNGQVSTDGSPGKLSSSTVRRYYTMISSLMKSVYRLELIFGGNRKTA